MCWIRDIFTEDFGDRHSGMASIILADPYPIIRFALKSLLQSRPEHHVIGEAGDGIVAARLTAELRPDILILEPNMPKWKGMRMIRELSGSPCKTRVLVHSERADAATVTEALENGAAGYVLKEGSDQDVLEAVDTISGGKNYLSPSLVHVVLEGHFQHDEADDTGGYRRLTNREREILRLCAEGRTAAEISGTLFISRRTVETHRANLMNKLGLRSQTELVKYACRANLIDA
jgi:two-component system response regulator NreC